MFGYENMSKLFIGVRKNLLFIAQYPSIKINFRLKVIREYYCDNSLKITVLCVVNKKSQNINK